MAQRPIFGFLDPPPGPGIDWTVPGDVSNWHDWFLRREQIIANIIQNLTTINNTGTLILQDEGVPLGSIATLNIVGSGLTATKVGTVGTVTSNLTVQDEGIALGNNFNNFNFTGAGVTATAVGTTATIAIPGGGAGVALPFIFGSGRDGAFIYDGIATPAWASLTGNTYQLTRNAHCTNVTVNSGINVNTSGYWHYMNGTLTGIDATSVIRCKGQNGGNGNITGINTGGGSDANNGAFTQLGAAGGPGAVGGANGGNATFAPNSMGATGGKGGDAGAFFGGNGPTQFVPVNETTAGGINFGFCLTTISLVGRYLTQNATQMIGGGGGGGAGASGGPGANTGVGGGAGAQLGLFAANLAGTGTVDLSGGNAGAPFSNLGNAAGGSGGGGGGYLAFWHKGTLGGWTVNMAGGTASAGLNGGANGVAGTAGNFAEFVII